MQGGVQVAGQAAHPCVWGARVLLFWHVPFRLFSNRWVDWGLGQAGTAARCWIHAAADCRRHGCATAAAELLASGPDAELALPPPTSPEVLAALSRCLSAALPPVCAGLQAAAARGQVERSLDELLRTLRLVGPLPAFKVSQLCQHRLWPAFQLLAPRLAGALSPCMAPWLPRRARAAARPPAGEPVAGGGGAVPQGAVPGALPSAARGV